MKSWIICSALLMCIAKFSLAQKPELVIRQGHLTDVDIAVLSPDEEYIATGSADETVKLWDINGNELKTFQGHTDRISSLDFSPDGQLILSGSRDSTAILWDLYGNIVHVLAEHTGLVTSVALSPDGQYALTGSWDSTAKLWDIKTGDELTTCKGHSGRVLAVEFSPNGQYILTGSEDSTARLWNISGQEITKYSGHSGRILNVAFSPDGKHILTGSGDGTAKLWDVSGSEIQIFKDLRSVAISVAFSQDGQKIFTGEHLFRGDYYPLKIWSLSGELIDEFKFQFDGKIKIESVDFSCDGKYALTANGNSVILWNKNGEMSQIFAGNHFRYYAASFSQSESQIIFNKQSSLVLFDLKANTTTLIEGHENRIESACFSPDGNYILTAGSDSTAKLWDLSGEKIAEYSGHTGGLEEAIFSPSGTHILTRSYWDKTIKLWSLSGDLIQTFRETEENHFDCMAFSPDGQHIFTSSRDSVKIWGFSGNLIHLFPGFQYGTESISFTEDGKYCILSSFFSVKYWNYAKQEYEKSYKRHLISSNGKYFIEKKEGKSFEVFKLNDTIKTSISHLGKNFSPGGLHSISPNGKFLLIVEGRGGQIGLWDLVSGVEIAKIFGILELGPRIKNRDQFSGYIILTPDGRFDGDEVGLRNLHYVVGLEPIPLNRLKERYYEPGLLSKLMGFNSEPLRDISAFNQVPLYPETSLQLAGTQLTISLTERNGGMGRTALYINGKEVVDNLNPDANIRFSLNLNHYRQYFLTGQTNEIGIKTYNAEGWLGSQLETVSYTPPKPLALLAQPRIFALCVGTADYAGGTSLDLAYAEKDAQQMAQALTLGGRTLINDPARIQIQTLTTCLGQDCPDSQRPTKANIQAAFEKLAQEIHPEDVFVLYLSGHGKTYDDYFYYLTQDMQSDYLADPGIRERYAISTAEFATWLNALPAQKQVMIIDACQSGRFNQDMVLLAQKEIPSSQIRALDRLRDRTGVFVISGSANDQASYEASPYGMGLLTYSLLMGMSGGALREDEYMDVERLFSFAEEQVPVLAEDVGAIQTPKFWKPEGSKSFDIGRATASVKTQIQPPSSKPVFSRASFFNDETDGDEFGLEAALNAQLRDFAFAKGEAKALIFVDADRHPGAYRLRGRYTLAGSQVQVAFSIFRDGQRVGERIVLDLAREDQAALARQVIAKAYRRIKP